MRQGNRAMSEKLTTLSTFRRLKAAEEDARAASRRTDEARDGAQAVAALVEETARLVERLEGGLKRAIAAEIAAGGSVEADQIRALLRRYERLSWHLPGQLRAILDAAGLSFLGLGAQPPTAEWGTMLGSERNQVFSAPHLVFFPGIAIMITVLGFNLLGDGMRDALDPRLND